MNQNQNEKKLATKKRVEEGKRNKKCPEHQNEQKPNQMNWNSLFTLLPKCGKVRLVWKITNLYVHFELSRYFSEHSFLPR